MTKEEKEYLENLEYCFEQLKSAYNCAQDEIKELRITIELLKKVCEEHCIEIPAIGGPIPF